MLSFTYYCISEMSALQREKQEIWQDFYSEIYKAIENVNTIKQEMDGWEKIAFEFRDEAGEWRMKYVRLRDEHSNCRRFFDVNNSKAGLK